MFSASDTAFANTLNEPSFDFTPTPDLLWPPDAARVQQRIAKQQAVLSAAARLFCEQGFHAAALDDVALRLHVSKPTLYYYVRNKHELIKACAEQGCMRALDTIKKVDPYLPLPEGVQQRLRAYAQEIATDFGWCLVRFAEYAEHEALVMRGRIISALMLHPFDDQKHANDIAWVLDAVHGVAGQGGRVPSKQVLNNVEAFLLSINMDVLLKVFHVKPSLQRQLAVLENKDSFALATIETSLPESIHSFPQKSEESLPSADENLCIPSDLRVGHTNVSVDDLQTNQASAIALDETSLSVSKRKKKSGPQPSLEQISLF